MNFKLYTLGCKVNQYETQAIRERLSSFGMIESEGTAADIYVVNTCAVTQKANSESLDFIKKTHKFNPDARIFVTGCSAGDNPAGIKAMAGVAEVIGNDKKGNLAELISQSLNLRPQSLPQASFIRGFKSHTRAFLKVQDGCNNCCSYCIIPKVRGRSVSRPPQEIIREAQGLIESGYKEIVLCGICLGSYGKDLESEYSLSKLIQDLQAVKGLGRLRLSSIEASDIDNALIKMFVQPVKPWKGQARAESPLCRHLHIPFQSGDDKVLKLMNRKFTSQDYIGLIQRLRKICPEIGITTDIMVGFPQEDDKSFKNTLKFLQQAKPSRIHVFSFSPRPGTLAFNLKQKVAQNIVRQRINEVREAGREFTLDFCRCFIGKRLDVLVESKPDVKTALLKGYSDNYLSVCLKNAGKDSINKFVSARIEKVLNNNVLLGRIVSR